LLANFSWDGTSREDRKTQAMLNLVPKSDCAQAREAASARLDGELPELDAARLDVHLRACAECRAYAAEIETITVGLRAVPLEWPEIRVIMPRRRRFPVQAAAAAAVVLAAIAGSSFALGRAFNGHGASTRTVTGAAYLGVHADANHERLLAQLRAFQQVPAGQRGRVMTI
jgi:predicted anti-sigma-YlaC factor YlaD